MAIVGVGQPPTSVVLGAVKAVNRFDAGSGVVRKKRAPSWPPTGIRSDIPNAGVGQSWLGPRSDHGRSASLTIRSKNTNLRVS